MDFSLNSKSTTVVCLNILNIKMELSSNDQLKQIRQIIILRQFVFFFKFTLSVSSIMPVSLQFYLWRILLIKKCHNFYV